MKTEKIYHGLRKPQGAQVHVITLGGSRLLPPRFDLRNHSPTGFEWGYAGSGPAQLALAICADVLEDDKEALRVYQAFKAAVIACIAKDEFTLGERKVHQTIRDLQETRS